MADSSVQIAAVERSAKIFNRDVVLSPLNRGDMAAWDEWARAEFIRAAQPAMTMGTSEQQIAYRIHAFEEMQRICFWNQNAWTLMDSNEGMLMTIWLSLRKKIPGLNKDAVWAMFTEGHELREALTEMSRVKAEVYVASGLISEARLALLTKKKVTEPPSLGPTNPGGSPSTVTSGASTTGTQPG